MKAMTIVLAFYGIVLVLGILAWPTVECIIEPIQRMLETPLVKF